MGVILDGSIWIALSAGQLTSETVIASAAAAFGSLVAAVKQAGRSRRPRYNDLWIAAHAIERGFGLLTLNRADFERMPGLRLLPLAA